MKKIAILQSNYIPWKGYFDIIRSVDEFVFYDSVQYTKNDWRNRNLIKTSTGMQWLTIPVLQKDHLNKSISDVIVKDSYWCKKHWKAIQYNYSKAPYFDMYFQTFEELYHKAMKETYLAKINYLFIDAIVKILGIKTKINYSSNLVIEGDKSERLVNICKQLNGNQYVSGPAAKDYINEDLFNTNGIEIIWMDYSHYPEYKQLFNSFCHNVSIIDLIFNCGPEAYKYMDHV